MGAIKFRTPTKEECEFIRANGIDPDKVMVSMKNDSSIVLLNLVTNDDIVIHPGPKSKREFPGGWE